MPDDEDGEIHDECYEPFDPDDEVEPSLSARQGTFSLEETLAEATEALDAPSEYVSRAAETTAAIHDAQERANGASYYAYDYDAGVTYRTDPGGKKSGDDLITAVFRFRLEVVSIMAAAPEHGADVDADGAPDPASPWVVRLEVPDRPASEHVMDIKARESKHKAAAWLRSTAPWCVIELEKEAHFLQALSESASHAPITIMPDHMGWFKHPDKGWVHLAPGRKWGISERGVEPTIYFEKRLLSKTDMFSKKLVRYGALVKPSASMQEVEEAKEALRNVILCAPRAITVPWLAANMLAPLRTTVLQTDVPTMMLLGKTGARKTSLSNAVASLFGRFSATTDRRGASVASWSSTYAPLSRLLYLCGDHPLVIQDYKKKTANKEAVTLVQGITDNTGSQRATRDGTLRPGSSVNALVLATGEQSFAEEESTASRVFELILGANDIDNEILARVQHAAQFGIMQRLGGDYLKWIAASGILDDDTFEKEREAATKWLASRTVGKTIHDGVIQTGVVMLTGLRIIALFADYYHDPAFAAEVRGYLREGADAILQRTLARGRAAADLSEVHRFFEAFVSALYVQDDCYSQRHDQRNDFEDEYLPGGRHTPGTRANGIVRHAYASADTTHADPIFFISEKQTFDAWFVRAYPQTTLTWASLKAEIMDLVPGARYERQRMYESKASPDYSAAREIEVTRGVRISLAAIEGLLS